MVEAIRNKYSSDVQIHFNRFVNNGNIDIYSSEGIANATNNWWGTNFQGTNPLAAGRVNSNVNAGPWIVLTVDDTNGSNWCW